MTAPYYRDDHVRLYLGDMREVLPDIGVQGDLIIADPPYGETSLPWDRWPHGWPAVAATAAPAAWCFGTLRMFFRRLAEFSGWRLSHDVIWEKPNGSGFAVDRFRRVHEIVTHWYRGDWAGVHHTAPRTAYSGPDKSVRRTARPPHTGRIEAHHYRDDGTRIARSVQRVAAVRGGLHRTQKPVPLLESLIAYGCPPGGLIIDPFTGSGSACAAARLTGRRAVAVEAHEPFAEAAARRLAEMAREAT